MSSAHAAGTATGAGRRMHVVVIGGGFAGITVCHGLEKSKAVDITLIDTKDYFEVCDARPFSPFLFFPNHRLTWFLDLFSHIPPYHPKQNTTGVIAALVEPTEHPPADLQTPFSAFLPATTVKVGEVTNVTGQHVIVRLYEDGDAAATYQMVPYDVVVVCTGQRASFAAAQSQNSLTRTAKTRLRGMALFTQQLARAQDIAIVGARLAAVELAARIVRGARAHRSKHSARSSGEDSSLESLPKTVTVFEKRAEILPGLPGAAAVHTRAFFEGEEVTFMTNCDVEDATVVEHPDGHKETVLSVRHRRNTSATATASTAAASTEGERKRIECDYFDRAFDLVLWCNAQTPNTDFLRGNFGDALDEAGRVRVTPSLQVHKHRNAFACGAVVSAAPGEEPQSTTAVQQAAVVVRNVCAMAAAGVWVAPAKLRHWAPPGTGGVVRHVYASLGDRDGFVVEGGTALTATGSRAVSQKRKAEAAGTKFLPAPSPHPVSSSSSSSSSSADGTPTVSPLGRFSSFRRSMQISFTGTPTLGSLGDGGGGGGSNSNSSSPGCSPGIGNNGGINGIGGETVLMGLVESQLGKALAYGLLEHGVRVHPMVQIDQIEEAQGLLRDVRVPVTLTADAAERPSTAALLAQSRCVVVIVWPSADDGDTATEMMAVCQGAAQAALLARVPHVVVLCPATRHAQAACPVPRTEVCGSCLFEACVDQFRQLVPRQLTVVYFEQDMRNPMLMSTLPTILLNHSLPLPLGGGCGAGGDGSDEGEEDQPEYVSYVDTTDVIRAVIAVHDHPERHRGREYHITGTAALTGADLAATIAAATGEDVHYQPVPRAQAFEELVQYRVPRSLAQLFAYYHGTARPEDAATNDLQKILCDDTHSSKSSSSNNNKTKKPWKQLSFEEWVENKRALFLSGTVMDDIDLDDVLKRPEAVRELISSVVSGKRIVHTEVSDAELVLGDVIGQGACAVVYRGLYRGAAVAVKQFKGSVVEFEPEVFRQEVAIISILRHPHLVSCIGASTRSKERLRIVIEYMPRGSLDTLLRTYAPAGALPTALQLGFALDTARAMKFLHGIGLIHGDLKPANLLVTEQLQIKLTDFDTCRFFGPRMQGSLGTPAFIPPELFRRQGAYTPKVDVYAFGITLWQIATRQQPYADLEPLAIPDAVLAGARPPRLAGHALAPLMAACWAAKAHKRPTFELLVEQLEALDAQMGGSSSGGSGTASSLPSGGGHSTPVQSPPPHALDARTRSRSYTLLANSSGAGSSSGGSSAAPTPPVPTSLSSAALVRHRTPASGAGSTNSSTSGSPRTPLASTSGVSGVSGVRCATVTAGTGGPHGLLGAVHPRGLRLLRHRQSSPNMTRAHGLPADSPEHGTGDSSPAPAAAPPLPDDGALPSPRTSTPRTAGKKPLAVHPPPS